MGASSGLGLLVRVKTSDLIEGFFERALNFTRAIRQLDSQSFEFKPLELELQSGTGEALCDDIVEKPVYPNTLGFYNLQNAECRQFQFRRGRHRQPRTIGESSGVGDGATGIVDGQMDQRVLVL